LHKQLQTNLHYFALKRIYICSQICSLQATKQSNYPHYQLRGSHSKIIIILIAGDFNFPAIEQKEGLGSTYITQSHTYGSSFNDLFIYNSGLEQFVIPEVILVLSTHPDLISNIQATLITKQSQLPSNLPPTKQLRKIYHYKNI